MTRVNETRRRLLLGSTAAAATGLLSSSAWGAQNESAAPATSDEDLSIDAPRGSDVRRHNAAVLKRNNALDQPPTSVEPAIVGRATSFSKALRRTGARVTEPEWGLPVQEAFGAFDAALNRAYRNARFTPRVSIASEGSPSSGPPTDFEQINELQQYIGDKENPPPLRFKFTNPLGGFAFEVQGLDPLATRIAPAPLFNSAVTAAEMVQLYWQAILRDTSLLALAPATERKATTAERSAVEAARQDIANYPYFRTMGALPLNRLFRANLRDHNQPERWGFPGVEKGPFLSQFLVVGTSEPGVGATTLTAQFGIVGFGTLRISQRQRTVLPGRDYLYRPGDQRLGQTWHAVQNGDRAAIGTDAFDFPTLSGTPGPEDVEEAFRRRQRFIQTLRDGANYVHFDKIYQEYLVAACIILAGLPRQGDTLHGLQSGEPPASFLNGLVAEFGSTPDELLNIGNPYQTNGQPSAQVGFATFGITHIVTLLSEVSTRAHKAAWAHKWTQRRIRPEEFAARVYSNRKGGATHPISGDLRPDRTSVFDALERRFGEDTYLLPMAFPEGCPTHPAYPSGHATAAGACVTIMKALFNETHEMAGTGNRPSFIPGRDGRSLEPTPVQEPLTIGGELNKLASNISAFREMAGVHWQSDDVQGMLLGEQVALKILLEQTSRTEPGRDGLFLPFYRERRRGNLGAPFFRFTLFSGEAVDIVDGKAFRVTGQFAAGGENSSEGWVYNDPASWRRSARPLAGFEELVRLQKIPRY